MLNRDKQVGWDIGGAHLKAVLLGVDGEVEAVQQLPCALWQGLDRLASAMSLMLQDFGVTPDTCAHAVTMTGELVDLFPNRHAGVTQITQLVVKLLGNHTLFYGMDDQLTGSAFLSSNEVLQQAKLVASANWHASATLIAQYQPNALLIDIGSTTTDIIAIASGKVVGGGFTDAERMQADTLVYTGVVRTPVMALAQKLSLSGQETNVAAEYFATMADVYRLTEELASDADMADTADGGEKTLFASANRLARMVGYDAGDKPMADWIALAKHCREKQLVQIQQAVMKQLKDEMTVVGAGAGAFLAREVAQRISKPYIALNELLAHQLTPQLAICLPAYAVANLAYTEDAS